MQDYDKEILDGEDFDKPEVNINPSFLIMNALLKAQNVLVQDEPKAAFLKYTVLIDYIETLAQSSNYLGDNYNDELSEALKKYKSKGDNLIDMSKKATIKLRIITEKVFGNTQLKTALKL